MEKTIRLKRELAYTGMILKIYRDTVVANGIEEVYDYIHHDGAAAVLPVTKDGKILMVRQYRNALDRFTLEIPAGKLDAPDEPKIECAARELEEETGFRSENLEFLMTVNTTVAFCDERIGVYIAKDLIPSKPRRRREHRRGGVGSEGPSGSDLQREDDGRKDDRGDPCVCPEGRNPVRAGTGRLKNQKQYCG